jgi:hypothetical protein
MGKVIGQYRKLYNEELHDLYSSPDLIRVSDRGEIILKTVLKENG